MLVRDARVLVRPMKELRRGFQGETDQRHFNIFTDDEVTCDHVESGAADHK